VWVHGGERSLYELAFAAKAAGFDVELRGNIAKPVFEELAAVTTDAPAVGFDSRVPTAEDLVIVPDAMGQVDLLRVAGSRARAVLMQLAPLGLWGWNFFDDEPVPDPLDVAADEVGTMATVAMATSLGFELWTHADRLSEAIHRGGCGCRWIGSGTPGPPPDGVAATAKVADIVLVGGNRWLPIARRVAEGIADRTGASVILTPTNATNIEVLTALARARVLVHPARIEGHSRLAIEARRVGTVPVMLSSNPYLAGADEDHGLVLAADENEMIDAVVSLLDQPARATELADRGRSFAAHWVEWHSYVDRVAQAIATTRPPLPRPLAPLADLIAEREDAGRAEGWATATGQHAEERALRLAQVDEQHQADRAALLAEHAATLDDQRQQNANLELALDAVHSTTTWRLRNAVLRNALVQRARRWRSASRPPPSDPAAGRSGAAPSTDR
jgi:hypothetical protein